MSMLVSPNDAGVRIAIREIIIFAAWGTTDGRGKKIVFSVFFFYLPSHLPNIVGCNIADDFVAALSLQRPKNRDRPLWRCPRTSSRWSGGRVRNRGYIPLQILKGTRPMGSQLLNILFDETQYKPASFFIILHSTASYTTPYKLTIPTQKILTSITDFVTPSSRR